MVVVVVDMFRKTQFLKTALHFKKDHLNTAAVVINEF